MRWLLGLSKAERTARTEHYGEKMSEWDSYAQGWDEDPGARLYAEAAFASLQSAMQQRGVLLAGASVLDFGCGTGLLTERLVADGAAVTAVDTSAAMLAVVQSKVVEYGWTTVTTSVELPESTSRFDLIVCSSVCSFLDDYPGMVATLAGLLAPGGLFVQWDWEFDETDGDPHGLSRTQITDALTAAGLAQVSVDIGFEIPFEDQTMRPLMGQGQRPRR